MAELCDQQKVWAKIVAKAWADEDYKQRLLSDPSAVLKAEGVDVPEGLEFKCVEASPAQAWLVLPPKPDGIGDVIAATEERLAAMQCQCLCPPCI
jgi:hypothetical protein